MSAYLLDVTDLVVNICQLLTYSKQESSISLNILLKVRYIAWLWSYNGYYEY